MKTLTLMLIASAAAFAQEQFDTPEMAAKALINAAVSDNTAQLSAIFGPQANMLLSTGNSQQDLAERQEFARIAQTKNRLQQDSMDPNRMILCVGDQDWPFPVPIVKADSKWHFDSSIGVESIKARRIGADELDAIEICAGFVGLERTYAERNQTHQYAAHIADLNGVAPQEFIAASHMQQSPYHGYYFKILTEQGASAAGGPQNYVVNGALMGGFALMAWPAEYGVTGVNTFIVNQGGVVYEKDLGAPPNQTAPPLTTYNPDRSWKPVE
jgi:Protein of unknown function (DUF2950)